MEKYKAIRMSMEIKKWWGWKEYELFTNSRYRAASELWVLGKFLLHFEKQGFRLKAIWRNRNEILLKQFLNIAA